jgi:hypothetical protein
MPYTQKNKICQSFAGANSFRIAINCEYKLQSNNLFKQFNMGMIIIFILLGIIIIVSFYYYKYIIQTGEEPFHCPDILHHILFPMVKDKIIYHHDDYYNGYHFDNEITTTSTLTNTNTNNTTNKYNTTTQ